MSTVKVSGVQYSGKWNLQAQAQAEAASKWPVPPAFGGLFAWGHGGNGQLGDGTTVSKSSPVQVGALTDWAFTFMGGSCGGGIKTTGTLWTWGYGNGGR